MVFQSLYDYIENPSGGFHLTGGMTFIGGLIGGIATFSLCWFIYHKRLNDNVRNVFPIVPCAITFAHGMGRIGCFFAGCCYGKPTNSVFGVQFPFLACKVHPTQLYEACFLFVLCIFLGMFTKKYNNTTSICIYLVWYGIFRFAIEFLRDDDRGKFIGSISPSQFWAIIMLVIGIISYKIAKKQYDIEK